MEAVLACDRSIRRCMGSRPAAVYDKYSCYAIQPRNHLTDAALCGDAHTAARLVWPFFANDAEEMQRLIEVGVDGILTDQPQQLMAVIESQSGRSRSSRARRAVR